MFLILIVIYIAYVANIFTTMHNTLLKEILR